MKPKTPVWVEIPYDWILACGYMRAPKAGEWYLSCDGREAGNAVQAGVDFPPPIQRVILRPAFVWPEWLKAKWIIQLQDGRWWYSNREPELVDTYGWTYYDGGDLSYTTFTPPPCTDWRQSKRQNPKYVVKETT